MLDLAHGALGADEKAVGQRVPVVQLYVVLRLHHSRHLRRRFPHRLRVLRQALAVFDPLEGDLCMVSAALSPEDV
jgi:hypothetical protein